MKNSYGRNEKKIKQNKIEMVKANISEEEKKDFIALEKETIKHLLRANLSYKNMNLLMAQNDKQIEMCKSSIKNSEKALAQIDSIESDDTIAFFFYQLQSNYGQYLSAILGTISGTFADDRVYEDDKKLAKQKKNNDLNVLS